MITVKLFAILKDQAGTAEIILNEHPSSVRALLPLIAHHLPAIADVLRGGKILVAVNQELANEDTPLTDGDDVALLPPFSGGQDLCGFVRIQNEQFSLDAEVESIKRSSSSIGGIVTFLGTTRDVSRGARVTELQFEHYPGMAERRLGEIRERAIRDFKIIDATIIHRVGKIQVGDDIVLVVVAAGHRDEAFAACRFCIDELKRITPIWKKETTQDGVVWVEEHP
jgi:molybdopterin synthase catalytic subunit/molybdopterin converting factor small subunit